MEIGTVDTMAESQNPYEQAGGFLLFSESKIELNLDCGQITEGEFTLEEQSGRKVEGYVYSSGFRMQIDNPELEDSRVTVHYIFDSTGMNVGDVLKGNFYIVSNRGEYVVPYVVMIQRQAIDSSLGHIKNLFHFTNLAKSNWEEAVKVFYHPQFEHIMNGNEARYRNLYRGLSVQGNKNYNLEEFLIGINKKQKIEYIITDENLTLTNPPEGTVTTINIERNGWGYTMLEIECVGDFLKPEKYRLSDKDFTENICHFRFGLDEEKLHGGKNPGRLIFKHLNGSFSVDICVVKNDFTRKSVLGRKVKSNTFALVRHYLDFSGKKLSLQKWMQLTEEILTSRVDINDGNLSADLMQAHIMLLGERYNEAKWLIDKRITPYMEEADDTLYCYYLYLLAIYSDDDYLRKDNAGRIRAIYEKNRTNWRLAWILIKISDDIRRSPEKKYNFAMEQVKLGCKSPVIYIEALKALSENPAMLMHLEEEQLRVLHFGAREGILSKDVMNQVSYLALRTKKFDAGLLRLLQRIYSRYGSDEIIQAICVQLMKGDRYGHRYFEWYALAVERNLPLTRLYEAYMMSMDLRREIPLPKRVLMYFTYQSELGAAQNAYLYAYVHKNRESMPEIYNGYESNMIRFAAKELRAKRVDKNLAYLYSNLVPEQLGSVDDIRALAELVLVNSITVEDRDIVNVVVIDERLEAELVFPVVRKRANVVILGNEHTILLEDAAGNRYYNTRDYSIERFFMPGRLAGKLEAHTENILLYDLYVCDENPDFLVITDRNAARYRFLAACEEVSKEYRGRLYLPLIRYYVEKDDDASAEAVLDMVHFEDVGFRDYNELLRYMTGRGLLDKALDYSIYYGVDNLEPKMLVRLCERLIDRDGFIENERVMALLMGAFERGKYDAAGLSYLVKFYRGPIKQLKNIWKAASNFYVDTYEICERMIRQTLVTGAFIGDEAAVLAQYVEGGAKTEVESSYLSYFSHDYFVNGRVVKEYMFKEIERLYVCEKVCNDVCMLAYLKYYSQEKDLKHISQVTRDCIRDFVTELYTRKGILFSFFAAFKNISLEAAQISNQTIIEYRGDPNHKTTINYVYAGAEEGNGFCREKMVDMYGGIYVKSFLLFFGESLQYYITEETATGDELTESGVVTKSDAIGEGDADRYSIINDIAIADTLKDYDTALQLLEEYKYREYLIDSVFMPQ